MAKHKKDSKKPEEDSLQQQVDQLMEAVQRERADAINIRRRHEEQLAGLKNVIKADVVSKLLPVIDNLERALQHTPEDIKDHDYTKGINGISKQFDRFLKELGVMRIKTVGEPFDPLLHEAVSTEGEGSGQEEIVCEELQAGYRLGDEVIRHAMVKVRS
jgi:molecular chaperone GrpE